MANNKYYDEPITSFDIDWGGDSNTGGVPVSGKRVQEFIKNSINSKVGYVGLYQEGGYYVLCKDAATFEEWKKTVNTDNPFGEISLINGHFDAPYNYSMKIVLLDPEGGYKSSLVGSTGNEIRFYAHTVDKDDSEQSESITVTFKITNDNGISSTVTNIYDYETIANREGVTYDLDGKLSPGRNTITISAIGTNTNATTTRTITYNYVDIHFTDRFDINKMYQFDSETDVLVIPVDYSLKGLGKTTIHWFFDGNSIVEPTTIKNTNPNIIGAQERFTFQRSTNEWLTDGVHTLQMYMECVDTNTSEKFYTPIYYREFIVEENPAVLNQPYIIKKGEFAYTSDGVLTNGELFTIYDGKEYENTPVEYSVYYRGKSECNVDTYIGYNNDVANCVSNETIKLTNNFPAEILKRNLNMAEEGMAIVSFRAKEYNSEKYTENSLKIIISKNDMNIKTSDEGVVLYLNASGRTNETTDRDKWVYTYNDGIKDHEITTKFSSNEYVEIMKPEDATNDNTKIVDTIPSTQRTDCKYLKKDGKYYVWTREFDWSNTSGWYNDKLRIGKDNMITIDFQPFGDAMIKEIESRGATFEFEFETTNVYDDNAVICRICGEDNYAPGISIYAAGAELVISREIVESSEEEGADNTNAGYMRAVSTKYKSEDSNRVSFVITPNINNGTSEENRDKMLLIYVNGECCGAYPYAKNDNFSNNSKVSFRGTDKACINISNIKFYSRRLTSDEILDNFIFYRVNSTEKREVYQRNDIVRSDDSTVFDAEKLLSQIPVMTFYQIHDNEPIELIHQEKKNKKLPIHVDITYIDVQHPDRNFVIKNAYITPQGTSSMNYPVKNFRIYTDKDKKSPATLYVGANIFKSGDVTNLNEDNLNPDCLVENKKYSLRTNSGEKTNDASAPVKCWCLKADFAESSSSHNTGTARYWGNVLKSGGYTTKAQRKAALNEYPYDVRTTVDGFPIVLFYQDNKGSKLRFEGKYNFNNDKSTEDVFGFTGGDKIKTQEYKYFYVGTEEPVRHYDEEKNEWSCEFGEYVDTPNGDSPLYAYKTIGYDELGNEQREWYMLRGQKLLDNPKMECWELLNSVNRIALFETAKGFGVDPAKKEKVGIVEGGKLSDEAFESRYPDCGDYYHTNSLKTFVQWLVSCRYLEIEDQVDSKTGEIKGIAVPVSEGKFSENYYTKEEDGETKISIVSLTKREGTFKFDYPNANFYTVVNYDEIKSDIKTAGYDTITLDSGVTEDSLVLKKFEGDEKPNSYNELYTEVVDGDIVTYYYIKVGNELLGWKESNLGELSEVPSSERTEYEYIKVGDVYYKWINTFSFSHFYEPMWLKDTPLHRALKFAVEKYDHIEMDKMAAYYIYLMRFGGVDQTVKNSMLTTEGPSVDDPESKLPSLWYFINYDNDTILGVKNDGRLVFDPYITRETKDGSGYVYAGRTSTLWNNLEADIEFMEHVTKVDNQLAKGEGNANYALSYNNAIREYETNQSDKWCERIYNFDAQKKYLDTFTKGWRQVTAETNNEQWVHEDYLYDVQGSRSAHRKWWLGRRFNIYDSKFCNDNFKSTFIKFRSTNLPAGSSFTLKSGEPIYYAWGHDNNVTEMTPTAIQPNDTYTFTTRSTFNIGSYLEVMGAANLITFDLRGCVGDLTELNIENCYSNTIGTKLKELYVGDHTNNNLRNVSTATMNFGGLGKAAKLEILDVTNLQNLDRLDGLEELLNIRELYTRGSKVSDYSFADGSQIETIEFADTVTSLSLINSSAINYDGLKFPNGGYGRLTNLNISYCSQLMDDYNFILNWINSKTETEKANLNLELQGINWVFNGFDYQNLFTLENVGTSNRGKRIIGGNITINQTLTEDDIVKFKNIFGDNCFTQGSALYISADTKIYVNAPAVIWEGSNDVKCDITFVGLDLDGDIDISVSAKEQVGDKTVDMLISATNGIIIADTTTIGSGYISLSIQESDRIFTHIYVNVTYTTKNGAEKYGNTSLFVKKRIYPNTENGITLITDSNSYNDKKPHKISLDFVPSELNDINYEGRGFFSIIWDTIDGTSGYKEKLTLTIDGENAIIRAEQGFDGDVFIQATIVRDRKDNNGNDVIITSATKKLQFTNPETFLTEEKNGPLYRIFVNAGIIKEVEGELGKLTKSEARSIDMSSFVDAEGVSIFKGNTELKSFTELQYFTNRYMGQMPVDGETQQLTPQDMFAGCTNLKEISFGDNFKYANDNMFLGCVNLEHIYGPYDEITETYKDLQFDYIGNNFANGCTKLKTCLISNSLKYIGNLAFNSCESMEVFQVAPNKDLKIAISTTENPFLHCRNINFIGFDLVEGNTNAKYQVKDGALYEVNDDYYTLVHMGKNTLSSSIPTNKPVYACGYSMEYRTEDNVVIPENVIFNGRSILYKSTGNSVTIKRLIGNSFCDQLFESTNYKGNYYFANGEIKIPDFCFQSVNDGEFFEYVIPEGIKTLGNSSFYGAKRITKITCPSTLEKVTSKSFWLCDNLKVFEFNGANPPEIVEDEFFNVRFDNIFVRPEYYENYKNNLMHLLVPFMKPKYLYNTGYVRVIQDGSVLIPDDDNVITVGGLSVVPNFDGYCEYNTQGQYIYDTEVKLNGEVIGDIRDLYTTIYLGDNSSLIIGNGHNFEIGVHDEQLKQYLTNNGWFYDKRFNGIRNNGKTTIKIEVKDYGKTSWPFTFGQYFQKDYFTFLITNNDKTFVKGWSSKAPVYNDYADLGYYQTDTFVTNDGVFNIETNSKTIFTGIDGIVINKLGDNNVTDPKMVATYSRNKDMNTKEISVNLIADTEIPNDVCVIVSDNKAHKYCELWNGETLYFTLPVGFDFTVSATSFVNGKKYNLIEPVNVGKQTEIELIYESNEGIKLNGNILEYHDAYNDWYICLDKQLGTWGEGNVENINISEIEFSDADGFNNTRILASEKHDIFVNAINFNGFKNGVLPYIPSYIEINMLRNNLEEINNFLVLNNKPNLTLDDCWISESFDDSYAWTSNGEKALKTSTKPYYIFGCVK